MALSLIRRGVPLPSGSGISLIENLSAWWFFDEASGQRWNAYQDTVHAADSSAVGTLNGHADFVAASTDHLTVANAAGVSLGSDTSYTWTIKFKADILAGFLFAKNDSSPKNWEYEYAVFISGTEIAFRLGDGVNSGTVSTSGANLQTGVNYQVTFGHDAENNIISIKLDDNDPVVGAWATGTFDGSADLVFGRAGEFNGAYYDGELWDAGFWLDRYLTAAEQSSLYGQSYPFGASGLTITMLDPDELANQYSRHDFSNVATLWQDTGKSTPVAGDTDPIRVAESLWNTHEWTAPSDAVRPIYKTNIQNSLGIGRWTGTDPEDPGDSELDCDATTPPVGDFTWFVIAKNSDVDDGSHIGENARYLAITGSGWDGTSPRAAMHVSDGTALSSSFLGVSGSDIFTIIEVVRTGTVYQLFTYGQDEDTADNASGFDIDKLGPHWPGGAPFVDWHFDGDYGESIIVTAALSDLDRARVRYWLADKWGLTSVQYAPYVTA